MNPIIEIAVTILGSIFIASVVVFIVAYLQEVVTDSNWWWRFKRWRRLRREWKRHMAGDHMGELKFHFRTYLADKDAELVEWWCRVCDYKTREVLDNKLYVTGPKRTIPEVLR